MPSFFALVGDLDVDMRGVHVDVASESWMTSNDAAFSEHRAERVPERVRRAALFSDAGADRMFGDDVVDNVDYRLTAPRTKRESRIS